MEPERVIKILKRKTTIPGDGYSYDEIEEAIEFAIKEVGKCIPKKPVRASWSPSKCSTCEASLSTHLGDGYFRELWYERCPECGQKLNMER